MDPFKGLTVSELKEQCKARKLPVGGVKQTLYKRLTDYEKENAASGERAESESQSEAATPAPTPKLDPRKATGVGLSPNSPIKDNRAPLVRGDALELVMLPPKLWTDSQPRTLECVYVLEASDVILSRNPEVAVDEQVNDALVPVLEFCTRMAQYTRARTEESDLSSSYSANVHELRLHMTEIVEEIMNDHPDCFKDISIHQMFSNWHDGELPTTLAGVRVSTREDQRAQEQRVRARQQQDDEEEDFQLAIQASLAMAGQQQQDMREYYQSLGGEDLPMVGAEDEGKDIDIPGMERILEAIPDSGITFFELTKALGIHNVGREQLQAVADGVYQAATLKEDGKLYPFESAEWPSDEEVKQIVRSTKQITLMDLYKAADVRKHGRAKYEEWSAGLIERGVIVQRGDYVRSLMVGGTKEARETAAMIAREIAAEQAQETVTNKDQESATKKTASKKTPSEKNTAQETPSRRQSLSAGSPFDNMPTITTPLSQTGTSDPGKAGSAEHRPASIPRITDTETPVKRLEDFAKLPAEMIRVRAAVLAHIRQWKTSFPRPADCTWLELEPTERSRIIRHINAYLSSNGLIDQPATQATTIDHLVNHDPAFPVAAGKNTKAVTAGVKKVYQEHGAKLKGAAIARAEGIASGSAAGGAAEIALSAAVISNSDSPGDDSESSAPAPRPTRGSARLRGRGRGGSEAIPHESAASARSKRGRASASEDDEEPPKKAPRKKTVVVSDDDSDA